MAGNSTTKTAVLRHFRKDTQVTFEAKVVAVNGPFSIRKQDGGELLKTEVIFENSEREIFRMNAWGSSLAFMVQRLAKLNALVRAKDVICVELNQKYLNFRTGTLPVEFKFVSTAKLEVLQECFELPELPVSSIEDVTLSSNLRKKALLTTEHLLPTRDGKGLVGNVVLHERTTSNTQRLYCIFKEVSFENRSLLNVGSKITATCTVRTDQSGSAVLHVESWHDVHTGHDAGSASGSSVSSDVIVISETSPNIGGRSALSSVNRGARRKPTTYATVAEVEAADGISLCVKGTLSSPFTQFGNHHMADVLLEDEADYMGVVVRVFKAPVSIEMIPPDTELVFQGTVVQKDGAQEFSVQWEELRYTVEGSPCCEEGADVQQVFREFKVGDVEAIQSRTACQVCLKLMKRFELKPEGYVAIAKVSDKRTLVIRLVLVGEGDWKVDHAVNSVFVVSGYVEKEGKRFVMTVQEPENIVLVEEGTDRKSISSMHGDMKPESKDAAESSFFSKSTSLLAGSSSASKVAYNDHDNELESRELHPVLLDKLGMEFDSVEDSDEGEPLSKKKRSDEDA